MLDLDQHKTKGWFNRLVNLVIKEPRRTNFIGFSLVLLGAFVQLCTVVFYGDIVVEKWLR